MSTLITLSVLTLSAHPALAGDTDADEVIEVESEVLRVGSRPIPEAEWALVGTMAELIGELEGVGGVRRGGGGPEPVIRGLGWERVQTRVGGVPLYGACPSRMDPPATVLSPAAVADGRVVSGLPSVADGPLSSGGALELSLDPNRGPSAPDADEAAAWAGYDGARGGYSAGTAAAGRDGALDYRASATGTRLGDYSSAGGVQVPAGHQAFLGSLALSARPVDDHRVWLASTLSDERDTAFPALPMDMRSSQVITVSGGTEHRLEAGALQALRLRGGAALVEHVMDNRDKPNAASMVASTDSSARSWSTGLAVDVRVGEALVITPGFDLTGLERDALRTRTILASDSSYEDALWPDASQHDAGVFTEARWTGDAVILLVGGRLDAVVSKAGSPGAASLQGQTIAEQWVSWYGADAAEHDRLEWTGGGNAALRWALHDAAALQAGLGVARRAAGITERYFAFAPAPGGFRVGNPALLPETRLEAELGATWNAEWARGGLGLFGSRIQDYILTTTIGEQDVDGDGAADRIQGYLNVDAGLAGADGHLTLTPAPWLAVPLGAQWVVAQDLDNGEPLAEIPPLEGHAALRLQLDRADLGGHLELGTRLVAPQDRVSGAFGEDRTPGFALLRAELGLQALDRLVLGVAGENLLDADYHEHLTREAALAVGGLEAGDEVPAPGRHLRLWLRWQ